MRWGGVAAKESLDHFDLLRSLWGSCMEGRSSQPNWLSPPGTSHPDAVGELLQSAELAFPSFREGSGWLVLHEQRETWGAMCQCPSERVSGFWGPWAPLGTAARLTLGLGPRVR